jgi:hypothetical protein
VSSGASPSGRPFQLGQGLVEYSLILVGAAAVAALTLVFFSPVLSAILSWIGSLVDASS